MGFRPIETPRQEQKALGLVACIDQGEAWIFGGAPGSEDFGGFIDRLCYDAPDNAGVYCACLYAGRLRLQIGFERDLPDEERDEVLALIVKARRQANTPAAIWYRPENPGLEKFLREDLPWKGRGHRTYELKYRLRQAPAEPPLPPGIRLIPFEARFGPSACAMMDRALRHTFADPSSPVFGRDAEGCTARWLKKAPGGECAVLMDGDEVVGMYVLKGAEIDLMAVAPRRQGRGLGRVLLCRAISHILCRRHEEPYLYCIESNGRALRFYLREGLEITAHSGGIFLDAMDARA